MIIQNSSLWNRGWDLESGQKMPPMQGYTHNKTLKPVSVVRSRLRPAEIGTSGFQWAALSTMPYRSAIPIKPVFLRRRHSDLIAFSPGSGLSVPAFCVAMLCAGECNWPIMLTPMHKGTPRFSVLPLRERRPQKAGLHIETGRACIFQGS
jgi:hypothetical protein